ncbi:MAG: YraN family protein [Anaerovoracaceae bacterium]|jgi:putative endonuclease|nr:YraN family protein [Anaerovoracaceae bacterium]
MNRQQTGKFGEDAAAEYLVRNGYRIIERNFRCRLGEIDIIAQRGDIVAFVEVKTRLGNMFGRPAEAVGREKQKHIRRVAQIFMSIKKLHPLKIRFDVLEVTLNHIENAF